MEEAQLIFEHFKELYYKELERKEVINSRLQWSISVFVILTAANIYCLNLLFKLEENMNWAMILFYGYTSITLIFAAIFLAIPLWGKKTKYLPLPSELNSYYKSLLTHYENQQDIEKCIKDAYEDYLIETYVACTESNTKLNDGKSKMISMANVTIIISSIFLLLAFVIIAPVSANKDDIYKIEIIKE